MSRPQPIAAHNVSENTLTWRSHRRSMLVCAARRRGDRTKHKLHNGGHDDATGSVPPLTAIADVWTIAQRQPHERHPGERTLAGRISQAWPLVPPGRCIAGAKLSPHHDTKIPTLRTARDRSS